jgi:plastocyanin
MIGSSALKSPRLAIRYGLLAMLSLSLAAAIGCPPSAARQITGGNVNRNGANANGANANGNANENENGPPPAQTLNVSIVDFSFMPETLTIRVGDTVRWTNNGSAGHTVTSGDPDDPSNIGQQFASMPLLVGGTFERTFDAPGVFDYFSMLRSDLTQDAVIVVLER